MTGLGFSHTLTSLSETTTTTNEEYKWYILEKLPELGKPRKGK